MWFDCDQSTSNLRVLLSESFDIPELAIDDILRERHPPKYELLENGWHFLLVRGLDASSSDLNFKTIQLALFWRDNVVLSYHSDESISVNTTLAAIESGKARINGEPMALVHRILRNLHERYLPLLLALEPRLEEIEELLIKAPSDQLLAELMEYSRQLKRLRRIGDYHQSLFQRFLNQATEEGSESLRRDLHEQAERLHSLCCLYYDTTSDLINGYLSVSSHRLNNIMKVLTVVTVIFVPLTFIAGIYGMNFEYIPELKWRQGYFIVLGSMLSISAALLWAFKRRGWL